ncbi:MAG: FAD-dependent oxidoreductase [Dehalococcoidales bacterium]|nr:FAD-dependent oxidoreductase [Dehalococcoidales bacterium]
MCGQMAESRTVVFPARSLPVTQRAEVLVVGGGTSGVAAAIAAARQGADTVLMERYGFLGGTAVGSPVPTFQEGPKIGGGHAILGIYAEMKERLARYNAISGESAGYEFKSAGLPSESPKAMTGRFEPAMLQMICLEMCQAAGVRQVLHTALADTIMHGDAIEYAVGVNKGGLMAVAARQFVDGTADGDLAVAAGAKAEVGSKRDGFTQPPTLGFDLSNVDFQQLARADWLALWRQFQSELPEVTVPRGRFMFERQEDRGTLRFVAMTHVEHVNAADPGDRTYIEVTGRLQAKAVMDFFRKHVPGCERCVITRTGVEAGIRESRRIVGDYVITRADVLEARKFADCVGCSSSWIDVHEPGAAGVRHEYVPRNEWFEVPYRALITSGVNNLYTVGRAVSCTHEALGALRTIPTGIMLGEAAGVAAALCAKEGVASRKLNVGRLQQALAEAGVFLGTAQPSPVPLPLPPGANPSAAKGG